MPSPNTIFGSNGSGHETAIRNARLRLIELEIASHRVKAELARLEAVREDGIADQLQKQFPHIDSGPISPASWKRVVPEVYANQVYADELSTAEKAAEKIPSQKTPNQKTPNQRAAEVEVSPITPPKRRFVKSARSARSPSAWVVSIAAHIAILLLGGVGTFVTLQNHPLPLMARSIDAPEEIIDEPVEIEIEPSDVLLETEETDLEEVVMNPAEFDLTDIAVTDLKAVAEKVGANPLADFDFSDALPSDVGTLMAGAGGGEPAGGGRRGRTSFFGMLVEGRRIMFLVDNSGSMTSGRIETTFLELMASVESMEPDQQFFVAFYSDRVYPMFHPEPVEQLLPATDENKQRLRQWLGTVELCTGGKLVNAIELAIKLRPQVVYLLSDGDITGSKTNDFMTANTTWPFVLHTLGMNVKTRENVQRLTDYAAAHRGMFRMVQPSPEARALAKQRPITHNRRGATWEPAMPIE